MLGFAKFITVTISISLLLTTMSGCYPMPKEGEYSTIPTTNNPDVVGSHGGNELIPNGAF